MIKGINKHVIEILETGNMYYEKALFFVKPEYANVEREILIKEAKKVLKNIDATSAIKKRKKTTLREFYFVGIIILILIFLAFL